jgi:aminoglycoside phosphotransferase (APT) family kinase protein
VPVRYRPGKRCTLRKGSLFLKCLADARGETINRDARLLWQAYGEGRLAFGVARPGGWLPAMNMVVQHRVPGESVVDRLWTADGEPLAYRLGRANASLALAGIRPAARFTYADQMKRTAKYARRLAEHMPQAWPVIARLMDRLARVAAGPADRPIHGAPHAHQWLDGPDGAQLVDFDRFGLGDPELEVATFVGEADFERSPHAAATGAAYRAGFEAVLPLDPDLLSAYRVHKHLAKALRTARAVRPDAHARAMAVLAGAGRLLERGA